MDWYSRFALSWELFASAEFLPPLSGARTHQALMLFGPGLIVILADNDAGAVTYSIQEMVVRLGIATGKGHAGSIGDSPAGGDCFP
jgi:Mn2+/Fe2+ NRAMP family transporter